MRKLKKNLNPRKLDYYKQCGSKQWYVSSQVAHVASAGNVVYRCPHCKLWHISAKEKKEL